MDSAMTRGTIQAKGQREQPGGQEVCVYGLSKAIIPHFLSSQPKDQETERGKLKFKVKTK